MYKIQYVFAALALAFSPLFAAHALAADNSPILVIDYERLLAQSTAGKDAQTKLQAVATQMNGELAAEQKTLQAEEKALEPLLQGKTPADLKNDSKLRTRVESFGQKRQDLGKKQYQRSRELQATREKAISDFNRQLDPLVGAVMAARGAVAVLDVSSVSKASPTIDITNDVLAKANQSIKTVAVSRVTLPDQSAQQQ